MATENERRYLALDMDKRTLAKWPNWQIQQGYFDLAFPPYRSLRIRVINNQIAILGVKDGSGLSREENEKEISLEAARFLLEHCSHLIEKTRYRPERQPTAGELTVDVFRGPLEGLVLIEIELESPEQQIWLPPWSQKSVEVTYSLSNLHLARLATELGTTGGAKPRLELYDLLPKRIPRIVLTGGPCSGKTTVMGTLKKEMADLISFVPEVASILISQVGIKPVAFENRVRMHRFNANLYRTQRIFEATSAQEAQSENRRALVLDRGTIDIAAYLPEGLKELEKICGTKRIIEFSQYDLVIGLEVPPKEVYEAKRRNNPARSEDYEKAFALGEKIKEVWGKHPNFHVIANGQTIQDKADAVKRLIRKFLAHR